jgi:hypothetical protein
MKAYRLKRRGFRPATGNGSVQSLRIPHNYWDTRPPHRRIVSAPSPRRRIALHSLHLGQNDALGQGSQSGIFTSGKSEPIAGLYRPTHASSLHHLNRESNGPRRPFAVSPYRPIAVSFSRARVQ